MAYNSHRRGPNVSAFIANLNAIPTEQEIQNSHDNLHFEDDLALFTNTQFFDFDVAQSTDLQGDNFDGLGGQSATSEVDMKPLDFSNGAFDFQDFNFSQPPQVFENGHPAPAPIQTSYSISTAGSPPSGLISPQVGEKRKASSPAGENYEDASRVAAEEDKRRRNTAASARFRVKKKQREQALEKSAKEMSDKVSALEGRINQLETENKWLKNLITEKNESNEDIAALWKKYNAENNERKASERKDGVGTKA